MQITLGDNSFLSPTHPPNELGAGLVPAALVVETTSLDPSAKTFTCRDMDLVHRGVLVPDLNSDWLVVQKTRAGVHGLASDSDLERTIWLHSRAEPSSVTTKSGGHHVLAPELAMPFPRSGDALKSGFSIPPKPVMKVGCLPDRYVPMPLGTFTDKVLPHPASSLVPRQSFGADYFVSLHNVVSAAGLREDGSTYPAFTANHLGARVKLVHTGLKPERWRFHLIGYEHAEITQYIEYGLPLASANSHPWKVARETTVQLMGTTVTSTNSFPMSY